MAVLHWKQSMLCDTKKKNLVWLRYKNFSACNTEIQIKAAFSRAADESDGLLNPLFLLQTLCCGYSCESSHQVYFDE